MPSRISPIVTGEIYHVFNRSVGNIPLFDSKKNCRRFYELVDYYRFSEPQVRFSFYNRAEKSLKESMLASLRSSESFISILAYAFMPNHYHFVLKQVKDNGISTFMRRVQNSYAKYYNIKNKRFGAVFQSLFKSVRVVSDEQLLHVVRYVHLNPVTSYVISSIDELETYPWTSYPHYVSDNLYSMVDVEDVLSHFISPELFAVFTKDQIGYQRTLAECKYVFHDSDV